MKKKFYHVKLGKGRRIILPSEVCRAISMGIGDTILIRVENKRAILSSVDNAIEHLQSEVVAGVPASGSLVDEQKDERRTTSSNQKRDL